MIQPFIFYNLLIGKPGSELDRLYRLSSPGGRFHFDVARMLQANRLLPRDGDWSLPWPVMVPEAFAMPDYDPTFNMPFAEVTDVKAVEIQQRIQAGEKFSLMYSGGLDSTTILAALLKTLTAEECKSLCVVMTQASIDEYPLMWRQHIEGQLATRDTDTFGYDRQIAAGYTPITGDEGDCIFGTILGINFCKQHPEVKPDDPYALHKDKLICYFAYDQSPEGLAFGRLFYAKMERLIATARMPIHTLHDFWWWLIFNPKYMNCSLRGSICFQYDYDVGECLSHMENWYNDPRYQKWSMANNNNGQKIQGGPSTYKMAARNYILDFTKDRDYYRTKEKIPSLSKVSGTQDRAAYTFAVMANYQRVMLHQPVLRAYVEDCLANCPIDWL